MVAPCSWPGKRLDCITSGRQVPRGFLLAAALVAAGGAQAPARFTSGVNVVEVYVSVTDSTGQPVRGLGREAFEVRENGDPQAVSTFAAGDVPLSVAVALDRSFSMAGDRLARARAGARVFLEALRPRDESMIVAIGSAVDVVAPLSSERGPQIDAVLRMDAFGTTGLHDAIIEAIGAIQPARGRRALVLLSDGADRYSRASATEALNGARQSDVMVYPIALGATRPPLFAELAALTGGRSFHVRDRKTLPETLRRIATELREQYLLGYVPSRPIVAGSKEWRSIAVTVRRPGVEVRARDGYLAR